MTKRKPKIITSSLRNYSKEFKASLEKFAEFAGASQIKYTDLGKGETYVLTKNRKKLLLTIRGGAVEGGYLVIN